MTSSRKKEIWAIGGGKGGVGKSLLCTNLGLDLAQRGYKVVLIDADFGGANLHTCLGINSPSTGISDFIHTENSNLEDILISTSFSKLKLASASQEISNNIIPKYSERNRLLKAIKNIDADFVLIDLGAGTSPFTLDFFLMADNGILMVSPEPTSIENSYRFIKSSFYRKLSTVTKHPGIKAYLDRVKENEVEESPKTPADLIAKISEISSQAGKLLESEISVFSPKLVVSQVRTANDVRVGYSMKNACIKYFGINLEYVGFIEYDEAILQSIRLRKPVLAHEPFSKASKCLKKITENLLQNIHPGYR